MYHVGLSSDRWIMWCKMLTLGQGSSASGLLTLWPGGFFVVGGFPVHQWVFSRILDSLSWTPVTSLTQVWQPEVSWVLSDVLGDTELSLVENHWPRAWLPACTFPFRASQYECHVFLCLSQIFVNIPCKSRNRLLAFCVWYHNRQASRASFPLKMI